MPAPNVTTCSSVAVRSGRRGRSRDHHGRSRSAEFKVRHLTVCTLVDPLNTQHTHTHVVLTLRKQFHPPPLSPPPPPPCSAGRWRGSGCCFCFYVEHTVDRKRRGVDLRPSVRSGSGRRSDSTGQLYPHAARNNSFCALQSALRVRSGLRGRGSNVGTGGGACAYFGENI